MAHRYSTGYRPDPAGHKRTPFAHLARRLAVTALPLIVSLESSAPAVFDQNRCGSCTGHATSCGVYTERKAAGAPLPFVPSPRGIYGNGRAIDRPDPSQPLTDDGAEPNQVMRGITEWGVRAIQAPTSEGAYSDCEPSNVNDEPTLGELEEESTHLVIGEYEITSTGQQRVDDVCTALAGGKPVCAAIAGGSDAFQGYTGGVLGPLNAVLDHYVCLIGYRTTADGKREFLGRNSWSESWGESGNFWLNEAGLAELGDLVVMNITVQEAA